MDSYLNVKGGFTVLRVKMEMENQDIVIPEFLKISRDITNERGYKSKYLAKNDWYAPQGDSIVEKRKHSLSHSFSNDESPDIADF